MTRNLRSVTVAGVAGVLTLAVASTAFGAITGSGASFPSVAYRAWCADSGKCSYTSKGSTGGINDFINGVVDFGASDAPLTDQQKSDLASKRGGATVKYFPTLLGAITVPTRIDGVNNRLRLDGKTIARIFLGEITKWDDPAITAQNKGTTLPGANITVCVRSDGSGTSFNFTRYLTKAYAAFGTKVGFSQTPAWIAPTLIKSPQNAGVANCVKNNANSVGYVDLGDALNAGLSANITAVGRAEVRTVIVKKTVTRGGKRVVVKTKTRRPFVVYSVPDTASISKAATNDKAIPADFVADLTLSPITSAYPITITTWLLGYSNFAAAGKGGSVADFKDVLNYFYSPAAQGKLASLGFAPLPESLIAKVKTQVAGVS
ncbi:MAG: phosphate ABC transporter substrate-binding protein PstS [Actinobacteria bacterium]|nr:phosphate ABC transporter substrate-binding protein PstS [Actinomycetota bacterium]